jgi:metal-responsive CopG/Arc/MetJ family transcriptional regulator
MRTTVTLDKDVAAAVDRLRRTEAIGVSEALNRLARAGLVSKGERKRFRQRTARMGPFQVDVSNVADALEVIEGPHHR